MNIVADTSAFLAVVMDEPERSEILKATKDTDLIAPEVLPFEIGNALSSLLKRNILSSSQALSIWDATQDIPVELRSIEIKHALNIALQHHIYAYDAYFLECAMNARCPLLTLDRKMHTIAEAMKIDLVKVTRK